MCFFNNEANNSSKNNSKRSKCSKRKLTNTIVTKMSINKVTSHIDDQPHMPHVATVIVKCVVVALVAVNIS